MLIIQPSGGLCNRMRVINSAYILAEKRGDKLIVLWKNCEELNCPFEELFELPPDIKIINFRSNFNPKKLFLQLTASQRINNAQIEQNKTDGVLHEDFYKALKPKVYLFTWEHFYPSADYHLFVPIQKIRERILDITKNFGSHAVGVHIRRTDHTWAINNSSSKSFSLAIAEELKKQTDSVFYVATDDAGEEAALKKEFPDKILSNPNKTLSRNSVEGIQDALIDLICLASTTKIFGSYYSSFTDIAADWNKIPKIIIGKNTEEKQQLSNQSPVIGTQF